MVAATHMVPLQVVGADGLAIDLGDEDLVGSPEPEFERVVTAPVARKAVGLAGPEHGPQQMPHVVPVSIDRRAHAERPHAAARSEGARAERRQRRAGTDRTTAISQPAEHPAAPRGRRRYS